MSNTVKGLLVASAVIAICVLIVLALDYAWCVENWGFHRHALECVYWENSLFGKFVQP